MKGTIKNIAVGGKVYKVWSDFVMRATYAENENGETKRICAGGYLSNELSIRKAIAVFFGLASFRK